MQILAGFQVFCVRKMNPRTPRPGRTKAGPRAACRSQERARPPAPREDVCLHTDGPGGAAATAAEAATCRRRRSTLFDTHARTHARTTHAHTHTHMYTITHARARACTHTNTRTRTRTHTHARARAHTHIHTVMVVLARMSESARAGSDFRSLQLTFATITK